MYSNGWKFWQRPWSERMLWASNWPHPLAHDEKPDDAVLLDVLLHWAEDDATRRRILVDNPVELYGFD